MYFVTQNPATGNETGKFVFEKMSDISSKITQLDSSFLKWKKYSPGERQNFLKKYLLNFQLKKDVLANCISEEMGKPIKEARLEVSKSLSAIDKMLNIDLSFLAPREVTSAYNKSIIYKEPLGVIYSIMPWNFPLWQVVRMVFPCLLSGNVVLLKHSELTPKLAELIEDCFGDTEPLLLKTYAKTADTEAILCHSKVTAASLTGSVKAGQEVYSIAARYLKKVVLELGGSDPYIVTANSNLKLAAQKIIKSRLLNNGQTCISAKRCLVNQRVLSKFIGYLKDELVKYKIGLPNDKETDLGPLAHVKFKQKLSCQIKELVEKTNAKLVYSLKHNMLNNEKGAFVNAEIYLLEKNHSWLEDQEFFAPILLLIPFDKNEEALQIANSTQYALGGGVFTEDEEEINFFANGVQAGQFAINDIVTSDINLPFGGFKFSGIGRELGEEGYLEFTQTKVVSRT